MRMVLIAAALIVPTNAAAAGDGQCDAKPFTLNKPAQPSHVRAATPPKPVRVANRSAPAKAKPAPKVAIGCKQAPPAKSHQG